MSTDINEILDRLKEYAKAAGQEPRDRCLVMSSRDLDKKCRTAVPALVEALEQINAALCPDCGGHGGTVSMSAELEGGTDCSTCDGTGSILDIPLSYIANYIRDALAPLKDKLP